MSKSRVSIPDAVAAELFILCRRRCALCYGLNGDSSPKRGQIAHINHDRTATSLKNLVWLCSHHHDEYDARRFQTKGYLQSEVRRYKLQLELFIQGAVTPQQVRWGPNDGLPPGISIIGNKPDFIPWTRLKPEVESRLLVQLGRYIPAKCSVEVRDYFERKNWTVRMYDSSKRELGHMWFGGNPDKGWIFDGLVRAGDAVSDKIATVWDTFQRHSDGTYRRVGKPLRALPRHQI